MYIIYLHVRIRVYTTYNKQMCIFSVYIRALCIIYFLLLFFLVFTSLINNKKWNVYGGLCAPAFILLHLYKTTTTTQRQHGHTIAIYIPTFYTYTKPNIHHIMYVKHAPRTYTPGFVDTHTTPHSLSHSLPPAFVYIKLRRMLSLMIFSAPVYKFIEPYVNCIG